MIRSFVTDLATIYTGINAPNFWGVFGGYGEILRCVWGKVVGSNKSTLQSAISTVANSVMIN